MAFSGQSPAKCIAVEILQFSTNAMFYFEIAANERPCHDGEENCSTCDCEGPLPPSFSLDQTESFAPTPRFLNDIGGLGWDSATGFQTCPNYQN